MASEYSGGGDPARSLALLWRSERPAGARGTGLSVDAIVAAAIEIADADGLGAVSMRRIADRLGAGTMSLYTHVPGKAELIDVMIDTVLGEAVASDDGGGGGGWRERLERIARDNWELFLRHPWVVQVATTRPPLGPNVMAKYERELRAVDGIGLTDVEMDAVVTLVLGHVAGAARGAVEVAQVARESGMSDADWWEASAPLLARVIDPSRFPLGARVGSAAGEAHGAAYAPEHAYEFGLARILDGVEALIRERS